jgi:hypothetical protein
MMYEARLQAENGAVHEFEFEGDNHELAHDHIVMVARDPSMHTLWDEAPEGYISVKFRRHYAEAWHDAGEVIPWEKLNHETN